MRKEILLIAAALVVVGAGCKKAGPAVSPESGNNKASVVRNDNKPAFLKFESDKLSFIYPGAWTVSDNQKKTGLLEVKSPDGKGRVQIKWPAPEVYGGDFPPAVAKFNVVISDGKKVDFELTRDCENMEGSVCAKTTTGGYGYEVVKGFEVSYISTATNSSTEELEIVGGFATISNTLTIKAGGAKKVEESYSQFDNKKISFFYPKTWKVNDKLSSKEKMLELVSANGQTRVVVIPAPKDVGDNVPTASDYTVKNTDDTTTTVKLVRPCLLVGQKNECLKIGSGGYLREIKNGFVITYSSGALNNSVEEMENVKIFSEIARTLKIK